MPSFTAGMMAPPQRAIDLQIGSSASDTPSSTGPDPSGPDAVQPVDQAQPADAANWWNRKHTVDMLV